MKMRNPRLIQKEKCALLVIDIQEKILPAIFDSERVITNSLKLINGFKIMNVPVFLTEQYPKGLGHTDSRILAALPDIIPIEKMTFSCYGSEEFVDKLKVNNISQVAICGIESHVCVVQTALDLIANDFQVFVASDAVSSRKLFDFEMSLRRMGANGAEISLTESILFEILNVCGTDEFRSVSKLVKSLF